MSTMDSHCAKSGLEALQSLVDGDIERLKELRDKFLSEGITVICNNPETPFVELYYFMSVVKRIGSTIQTFSDMLLEVNDHLKA